MCTFVFPFPRIHSVFLCQHPPPHTHTHPHTHPLTHTHTYTSPTPPFNAHKDTLQWQAKMNEQNAEQTQGKKTLGGIPQSERRDSVRTFTHTHAHAHAHTHTHGNTQALFKMVSGRMKAADIISMRFTPG